MSLARWRLVALVLSALLLAGIVTLRIMGRDDDGPVSGVTVGWGGGEGVPACRYDEAEQTVDARLEVTGTASHAGELTVRVTAYADENTSEEVGSAERTVRVDGEVDQDVVVTLEVDQAPHVGEDDEAACRLAVVS